MLHRRVHCNFRLAVQSFIHLFLLFREEHTGVFVCVLAPAFRLSVHFSFLLASSCVLCITLCRRRQPITEVHSAHTLPTDRYCTGTCLPSFIFSLPSSAERHTQPAHSLPPLAPAPEGTGNSLSSSDPTFPLSHSAPILQAVRVAPLPAHSDRLLSVTQKTDDY